MRSPIVALVALFLACSDGGRSNPGGGGGTPLPPLPRASCAAAGGSASVAAPTLRATLEVDGEGWLASPAIADLDGDGTNELVAVRGSRVFAWRADGSPLLAVSAGRDRIWASPVVADFTGDSRLEIAVASRDRVTILDAAGAVLPGFPQTWGSELRTLGAGDLDGDGRLDLVGSARVRDEGSGKTDVVMAWRADGQPVAGFPPERTGSSGCQDTKCYFAGTYDQNLAIADLDGDGKEDVVVPHDNAYASFYKGTGVAFDANALYENTRKTPGVRYLHAPEEAAQGYADDEATGLQAHFTNTAPAIADLDGDGTPEVLLLASVQNAAQDRREQGVGLWAVRPDASRLPGWERPFHAGDYVMGLWDGFARGMDDRTAEGADNLVGATNQVTVADLDPARPGPELVFAGFDGRIHAVGADRSVVWAVPYAEDGRALTGGVVVADLSGDGVPEIVLATYGPSSGALLVLAANGEERHRIALPGRGAMAVPTVGDLDGDGQLEIVVSTKDEAQGVLVFTVPGSSPGCLLWPTGRANLRRSGFVGR